jgi:hypothetical protein
VALFGISLGNMSAVAFVKFSGLLKAGHTTQPRRYPDRDAAQAPPARLTKQDEG